MKTSVKIDASDVMKNIPVFTKRVQDEVKKTLIKSALVDVETVAKQILTAGGHVDTGRLRASIHTEYLGQTGHSYSASSVGAKTGAKAKQTNFDGGLSAKPSHELEVIVGTNVEYARRIHYEQTPYLQSALENARANLLSRFKNII
jgi:hypothetical protein